MIPFEADILFYNNPPFNLCLGDFKERLDDLIVILRRQLAEKHGVMTSAIMLLPTCLACKYVYNSVIFVRSILDKIIIDPFDVSYNEYAKKFENLADSFSRILRDVEDDTESHSSNEASTDDFDPFLIEFWKKLEELFEPIEPEIWNPEEKGRWGILAGDIEIGVLNRVRRPKTTIFPNEEKGKLSNAVEVIIKNDEYLITVIWTCLEDLAELLREIDELLNERCNNYQEQEELFLKRRSDYLNSIHGKTAIEELYNDIIILSGIVDEYQLLSNIKVQIYFRLRNNMLGQRYLIGKEYFINGLFRSHTRTSQTEFNEFLKINCQYRHICKLVNYHSIWSLADDKSIFVNSGTDYIVNVLVSYLSSKICFDSRKSYAALWLALIDLNLLKKSDAGSFKDWVNDSFLKDAPNDSSKKGKMKNDKSVRGAVDDMYKFQTKDAKQKQFKDLTEEEIARLKNGVLLKELYRDCILILSKAFDIDLKGKGFQPYITEYSEVKDFLSDFPEDSKSAEIMECFSAYEDFLRRQIVKKR